MKKKLKWFEEAPDPRTPIKGVICKDCKEEISMLDVEGSYSGKCEYCRDIDKERQYDAEQAEEGNIW